jgi:hypothetical protein
VISSKNFKEKRAIFTSHFVQSRKLAKRIEAIPVEKRSPEQKRFLADLSDEERGIVTIADVHEIRARGAEASEPSSGDRAAEAERIAEQKRKADDEEAAKRKEAELKLEAERKAAEEKAKADAAAAGKKAKSPKGAKGGAKKKA